MGECIVRLIRGVSTLGLVILSVHSASAIAAGTDSGMPFRLNAIVQNNYIPAPANLRESWLEVRAERLASLAANVTRAELKLSVFGANSAPVIETSQLIEGDEAIRCFSQASPGCNLRIRLPLAVEREACHVSLSMKQRYGSALTTEIGLPWGQCRAGAVPQSPAETTELAWNGNIQIEEQQLPGEIQGRESLRNIFASLQNKGPRSLEKSTRAVALAYDRDGSIVWGASGAIPYSKPNTVSQIRFEQLMAPHQWHRTCLLRLIADVDDSLPEQDKADNELNLSFGLCEADPEAIPGNLPDLIPWLEWEGDGVGVHLINIGNVRAPKPNLPIDWSITLINGTGASLAQNTWSYRGQIEAYGEEVFIHYSIPPSMTPATCRVAVTIDPAWHLVEKDHTNNTVVIDRCR